MTPPFRPLPLVDPTPPKGPARVASPGESVHRRVLRLARQVQHPLGPAPRPNRAEFPYVGTIVWPGLPRILVETAAGQARHWGGGAAQGGGSTQMLMHYGEFEGTTGADGDPIDVYVGPERGAPFAFVVHQQHPGDRTYDEDKVLLGFTSADDALAMYRAHYDRRGFVQAVRRLSIVELADWLRAHGSKGGRIDGGQPLSKAEPAVGEVEVDGADLEFLGLMHLVVDDDAVAKAAGHKYIRRVPKPGGGYRYYYAVTGGANLGHATEFVVGAAFAAKHDGKEGHFHVVEVGADGKVKLRHDETGNEQWIAADALRSLLLTEHVAAINEGRDRRESEYQAARVFGSAGQKARTKAALARFVKAFPEAASWIRVTPDPEPPRWTPKGYGESQRAIETTEALSAFLEERDFSPAGSARLQRVASATLAALEARYGDFGNRAAVKALGERLERISPNLQFRTLERRLRDLAGGVKGTDARAVGYRLTELIRTLKYEHAKLDLAIDRKEPLRTDVAMYLDEIRSTARSQYYIQGRGTRTGLQTLFDLTGQVRTTRGVEAMETLLHFPGGPATANTRAARATLGYALSDARERMKAGARAIERAGSAGLVSTASRATPELDAAIAADTEFLATLEPGDVANHLESPSAAREVSLAPMEREPGGAKHRFSQLRPPHSAVKRLFEQRFGVRIALDDEAFDAFLARPEAEIDDPKGGGRRTIHAGVGGATAQQIAKLSLDDRNRFRRYQSLVATGWGLYGDDSPSADVKRAAAEVAMATSLSHEARADALRSIFNALTDMEKTLGGRVDLSNLPVVVSDRFVGVGAFAHYRQGGLKDAFDPSSLGATRIAANRWDSYDPRNVKNVPHIAVGTGVDKSLGHEVAHYLDNRITVRAASPSKVFDEALVGWAQGEAASSPAFAARMEELKGSPGGDPRIAAGALAEDDPELGPAVADLERHIRYGQVVRAHLYLSNVVADLVKRADHPSWQTPKAQALRQDLLNRLAASQVGKAQVELHEAVAQVGAGKRFVEADAQSKAGDISVLLRELNGENTDDYQYYAMGTEVVARSIEQYLFEDGLKEGRVNTALTHPQYDGNTGSYRPHIYFTPEEWAVVGPKVGALLAAFRDNMTKAQASRGERLGAAALLARVGALVAPAQLDEELDEGIGEALWAAEQDNDDQVEKGAGHKYIRREAKPGGGWRYFYRASGVTSVRGDDGAHFAVGAKFAVKHAGKAGHFEIVGAEGGELTVRHDETGHTTTLSRATLAAMFAREHAHLVEGHKDRLKRDLAVAREKGTAKQVARLLAEAKRHGHADLAAPASPKVIERSPAAASRPPEGNPAAPASLADVPVGSVVRVGAKRFERTLSAWAEVDAKGKRTGSVLTFKRLEGLVAAAGGFKVGAAGPAAPAPAPAPDDGQLSAAEQRQREEAARRSAEKRRKAPEVETPAAPKAAPAQAGGEPEQVGLDLGDEPDEAGSAEHVEVGSHVAGSRKDLAGLSTGEVRDLPIEDAARVITRDKLLPTWSEASMKAAGAGPGALLLLRAIRRTIPPKPDPSVLNDPAKRMAYVEALAFMGRTFDGCKSAVDVDTALREWGMLSGARKNLGQFTSREAAIQASRDAYASVGKTKSFIVPSDRQGMVVYHREAGRWTAFGPLSAAEEEAAEREGGGVNPYQARITVLGPAFRKLMRAPDDWDDGFRFRGKVYATAFVEGQKADREGWPKADDKDAAGAGATAAPPKRTVFRWQRDAGLAPVRLGGRPVETADAGAMAAEFGLHNVQFGLWATQEDRDHHLRACHGALRDLSDLLGLPPAAITLQRPSAKAGRMPLSIGIAARGKGTAAAHYEPFSRDEATGAIAPIINLTRFTGGGSLAHEWGHFLDNIIAEAHGGQRRRGVPTGQPGYLSEGDALDAVDPSIKKAIQDVMGAIKGDRWTPTAFHLDAQTLGTYWSSTREMFARGFESYIEDKLAAASRANTYLATGTQKTYLTGKGRRVKVPTTELPMEHQAAVAASEAAVKRALEARNRVAQPELSAAQARNRGQRISPEVARKIYERADQHPEVQPLWAAYRAAESAARAARHAQFKEVDAQPYPQGVERQAINAAFDRLFEAMRIDRTLEKALDLLGRVRALAGGGR